MHTDGKCLQASLWVLRILLGVGWGGAAVAAARAAELSVQDVRWGPMRETWFAQLGTHVRHLRRTCRPSLYGLTEAGQAALTIRAETAAWTPLFSCGANLGIRIV
jgi:hypothetical protein